MRSLFFVASFVALFGITFAGPVVAQDFSSSGTTRLSKGTYSGAGQANAGSVNVRISKNGRFVVFESTANNLVTPSTTSGRRHIYLYDRQADSLELIDVTDGYTSVGAECPTDSFNPSVSGDGRYVAYSTDATVSLMVTVDRDSPHAHINVAYPGKHVYVRDRLANVNFLIDQGTVSVQRQAVVNSVPQTVTNELGNKIPLMETIQRRITTTLLAGGNVTSDNPRITADGRYVVYDTDGDNLLFTSDPLRFPVPSSGAGPNQYNFSTGVINDLNYIFLPTGTYLDSNFKRDVYVRDGQGFSTTIVSLGCQYHAPQGCGIQGTQDSTGPSISDDGAQVVFASASPFLDLDSNGVSDVFMIRRDAVNGEVASLMRVSNNVSKIVAANGASTNPALSADGRYVAYQSAATNIVSGDTNGKTDVFVYDVRFNKTILCSQANSALGNGDSTKPDLNGDGQYVSFQSNATNFGATNGKTNIYVGKIARSTAGDITGCTLTLASAASGSGANGDSTVSSVALVPKTTTVNAKTVRVVQSAVAYQSIATDLAAGVTDSNSASDIFQAPLCSTADLTTDTDSDGTVDCFDQCWKDPLKVADADSDGDGVADCEDNCPSDPQKITAGVCGCGTADVDTDADGTPDCTDQCPADPAKKVPGACGCGIPDVDANGNGKADCLETAIPGVTPVPSPGATASPTPNIDIRSYTPPAAVLRRAGKGKIAIEFNVRGLVSAIKNFKVTFTRLSSDSSGDSKTITRTTIGGVLSGFPAGTYRATYQIVTKGGLSSLASKGSNKIRIN